MRRKSVLAGNIESLKKNAISMIPRIIIMSRILRKINN
jgi:hypothetical protein